MSPSPPPLEIGPWLQIGYLCIVLRFLGSKWDIEMQRVKLAVSKINKMQPKPKFVLIGGDLVDAFPGTARNN